MNMFECLHRCFKIATYNEPSSENEIVALEKYASIPVPEEYKHIVRQKTEIEILVSNEKYIRIWGANGCIEMNSAYLIQKYIPFSLAIGDDEGGNAIIYATGKRGFGLYLVAFNDLDDDEMVYISPTLRNFLVDGYGIENVLL